MAEETSTAEQSAEKIEGANGKSGMMKKLLIFGVPAFLVQLILVYFLTAKFVVPMTTKLQTGNAAEQSGKDKHGKDIAGEPGVDAKDQGEPQEQHIYTVKDMIINPAGTNGQRYLLTTIGFNVSTDEAMKALEKKEIAVRDMLNSVLTSKTMTQLVDVTQREALRQEITNKARQLVSHGKLTSVYFSKYIVQ